MARKQLGVAASAASDILTVADGDARYGMLVNEFWTTAKPSIATATDVPIVFNASNVEGGCTQSGANVTLTKVGLWRVEASVKYDFFNGAQPKVAWINAGGNRMCSQDTASTEGNLNLGRTIHITGNTVVNLGAWHSTGSTRLLAAGRYGGTCLIATWLGY